VILTFLVILTPTTTTTPTNRYVYRDLKPENILLGSTGHCKISDLGLAKRVSKSKGVSGSAGTRGYWAPEMITKGEDGKSQSYGFEVDFWSLGCVAYAFFDGTCPFYHERIHELYGKDSKIAIDEATKNMEIEYGNNFPDLAKSLCEGLLTRDPKARLGCDGWKEVQKHAFFEGMDLESLVAGSFAPPFVPKDALNANDQNQIGAFDKAAKGTKWEPDDQAKFDDWGFTHKERFYDEFIASLEWAKEEGNTDLRYAVKKSSACVIL
jgi:serine/threonine protein kinase